MIVTLEQLDAEIAKALAQRPCLARLGCRLSLRVIEHNAMHMTREEVAEWLDRLARAQRPGDRLVFLTYMRAAMRSWPYDWRDIVPGRGEL